MKLVNSHVMTVSGVGDVMESEFSYNSKMSAVPHGPCQLHIVTTLSILFFFYFFFFSFILENVIGFFVYLYISSIELKNITATTIHLQIKKHFTITIDDN